MDIRRTFDNKWAEPGKCLHDLLGRRGFELPTRANLDWIEIEGDNWVLAEPSPDGKLGRTFHIEPNASGNIIVFCEKCTAIEPIYLRGSGNIAIISGPDRGKTPLNLHFYADKQLFFLGARRHVKHHYICSRVRPQPRSRRRVVHVFCVDHGPYR